MGLYSIVTRATGTVLTGFGSTSDIYNFDHENHVTHTEPESINSAEATLTDMQATANPFPSSLSLPASMTDEVQRLRFAFAQIKQRLIAATTAPQWYQPMAGTSSGVFLPPTAFRREITTPINISSGAEIFLPFPTLIYSYGFTASTPSASPPVTGNYLVGASVGLGDGVSIPTGVFRVMIKRQTSGGVRTNVAARTINTATDAADRVCIVEGVARFASSDFMQIWVFQNHGVGRPLTVNATIKPAVWMALVGR